MIPAGITLSAASSALSGSYGFIEVPEGGSVTRYMAFTDSSMTSAFRLRRRVRRRPRTADAFGEWGSWTEWTETLPIRAGGLRLSQTPITVSSSDISPTAAFDLAEYELQVKEDIEGEMWSQSLIARAYFAPNIAIQLAPDGATTLKIGFTSSWLRHNNTMIVEDVLIGQATTAAQAASLSSLEAAIQAGRSITMTGLVADGSAVVPITHFKRYPVYNEWLTFVVRFATCDAELDALRYIPAQMTYAACNTPVLVAVPHPEDGYMELRVTDSGDKGIPIAQATVMLLDGIGSMDVISAPLGASVYHRVPPLDIDITYQVVAAAASGQRTTATRTVRCDSNGHIWLNWGDELKERLALRANIIWSSAHSREKSYFAPAEGLPKVYFGRGMAVEHMIEGDVIYPASRTEPEAVANAVKVMMREPYGKRRIISIDSAAVHDRASDKQTVLSFDATEVASWQ